MPPVPRPRRPRPVADAPVEPLVERAEELAKGWLMALVERRPLGAAGELPLDRFAAEAPALLTAVARALASDAALADLLADGPRVGDLAPGGPAATADAAEALRAIVWTAALNALDTPDPAQLADLADRLARITTGLLAASAATAPDRPAPEPAPPPVRPRSPSEEPTPPSAAAAPPSAAAAPPSAAAAPPSAAAAPPPSPTTPQRATPLWLDALDRRIGEGGPGERLALLLVELDGLERLEAAADGELGHVLTGAADEVRRAVRRGDLVAHEHGGRTWILASETTRAGAEALAHRIVAGIGSVAAPYGAPLTASVGLAIHPDDGRDAGALAAYAEEEMLAARAAGVRVLGDAPLR